MPDEQVTQLSQSIQLSDPLLRLILVVLVLVGTWLVQRVVRWLIIRLVEALLKLITRIRALDIQFEATLSAALVRPVQLFIVTVGLRVALALVDMAPFMQALADRIAGTLWIISLTWLVYRVMDVILQYYVSRAARATSSLDETIIRFLRQTATLLIFVIAFTLILQRWGQDVGGLIAGLGIGDRLPGGGSGRAGRALERHCLFRHSRRCALQSGRFHHHQRSGARACAGD